MSWSSYGITFFLALLPISELRGAIPFAYLQGASLPLAAFISLTANILVAPIELFFLEFIHGHLYKWSIYARLFDRFVVKARQKVQREVERYGYVGLALFVGIPLPITGVWTAILGSWILNMDKKKSVLAAAAGALLACIIVCLILGFGLKAFYFLINNFQ
jgi:uncharacterized membrane protein